MTVSRRDFVKTSVLGAIATAAVSSPGDAVASTVATDQGHASQNDAKRPIIICAHNGYAYAETAYAFLKSGGDTLDAGILVVKGPENDPKDDSVGLGGLPNEEGVVELDACCMPRKNCGLCSNNSATSSRRIFSRSSFREMCITSTRLFRKTRWFSQTSASTASHR